MTAAAATEPGVLAGAEVLALPMGDNDAGAATVRDYLVALTLQVWDDEEEFSGKRPFGNSDWSSYLLDAVEAGCGVSGGPAEELIRSAIQALVAPPKPVGYLVVVIDEDGLRDWDGEVCLSPADAEPRLQDGDEIAAVVRLPEGRSA